jgi:hypothetical protein
MTLLAQLAPRPRPRFAKPTYPRALALAAATLLGACGGVVGLDADGRTTVDPNGGVQMPYEPAVDGGAGGYKPVQPPGVGGSPRALPSRDAGAEIQTEAAPKPEPLPNPAGGLAMPFDAEVPSD